jgi:sugar diacid utilization regulator
MLALSEIAGAVDGEVDQHDLLRMIARHICVLTGVERCSVYLREPNSGLFRGRTGYGSPDLRTQDEADLRIQQLVCGVEADRFTQEIVATRRPVVVADTTNDPRPVRSAMRTWGVRSMLGVPMITHGEVIGIIYLDDGDTMHRFVQPESEIAAAFAELAAVIIVQAQMAAGARRDLRTLAYQNDLLERAASLDDQLTELVINGATLAEIAAATADLTGKPVDVYDRDGYHIAGSMPKWMADTSVPRVLEPKLRSHPTLKAALDALEERRGGVIGPLPDAGVHHRFIVSPIATRDEVWGTLVVMESGSRFGAMDMHIARRAATNVALALASERRSARAEWNVQASLAAELIRGASDVTTLTRRAEYLGIDLDAPHVVCLIASEGEPLASLPDLTRLALALQSADRHAHARALAACVPEGTLLIFGIDPDVPRLDSVHAASRMLEATLGELCPDASIIAALSPVCLSVADYPDGYAQARQVMDCVRALAPPSGHVVLAADDLGIGRLMLSSTNRAQADRFVEDTLGPLLDPDNQLLRDLLETVRVFLAEQRSVRRAASALNVHENTVRYRLARVEGLTGLAVATDTDSQLTAQMALLILRLRGLGKVSDTP